jgi:hypothetical protein
MEGNKVTKEEKRKREIKGGGKREQVDGGRARDTEREGKCVSEGERESEGERDNERWRGWDCTPHCEHGSFGP